MSFLLLPSVRRLGVTLLLALPLLGSPLQASAQGPSFAKSFDPSTIGPGAVSTLGFTIANGGTVPVRGLAFVDNLPAGMTVANPARVTSTCLGIFTATAGATSVSLTDGGVGASSSCLITVDVTSATPGTHTNVTGDLTSDAGNSGTATADLTVATDRPGFGKSFAPNSVFFGDRSRLTFTIDNTANPALAANLAFTDNLPAGMVVASPANASTTCIDGVITAASGSSTITFAPAFFSTGTVAAGASCIVGVDVLGNAIGELGNTSGELTSTPQFGATRSSGKASATLTVAFEQIVLTKSFLDDPTTAGDLVTLEFTVRNLDRRAPASAIAFTDDLESVLSGLTAIGLPLADPCGDGSQLSGSSVLSLTGGSLGIEEVCTFSVDVQVPVGSVPGTYTNVTSAITAEIGGSAVAGTPATDLLFVDDAPVLSKSFVDDPVGAGDSVTLEFTLTNASIDQTATEISFRDVFVSELPTASAVPADGFCGTGSTATFVPLTNPVGSDANPANLNVEVASLAPGESCTFSITLDVMVGAAAGTYGNTTTEISSMVGGVKRTGRPASDDLEIVGAPEMVKEFIDDPATPGDTVTLRFTIEHAETAPGAATDISFTDDLEAVLSGLVAIDLPANDVCGSGSQLSGSMTLSLTGGSLVPGETCSFDVTLLVPANAAAGSHTNTTSNLVATVLGLTTMNPPSTAELIISGLALTKEFTNDPVLPGGSVNLRYTLQNDNPSSAATAISFTDDLDDVIDGLAGSGLPLADVCGLGSTLIGLSSNQLLIFQNGSLAAGESCSFDVVLEVPSNTQPDTYASTTGNVSATLEGSPVTFDGASDELQVSADFIDLTKEFVDDPVSPGENVTLRFRISNLSKFETLSDITFSDDLDAALAGLTSVSGSLSDVCGAGSQITGSAALSFTGGSLAPAAACTFDVTLTVPAGVLLGTEAVNITSDASGLLAGLEVRGDPASDTLRIDFLSLTKKFSPSAADAGDIVTLVFSIENSSADSITGLAFSDDLAAALSGLQAIGLPMADVCGEGSVLDGSTFLTFNQGTLLPNGSCSFSVDLQVPAGAAPGDYLNVTSDLFSLGLPAADPASATFTVNEPPVDIDSDGDGVLDSDDVCPQTVIPEGVPTQQLRPNRFALVDGDTTFDSTGPQAGNRVFTTVDTAGCSCEQIIDALGLGNGHTKFGCSLGAMRDWIELVSP